jgi:hypothetical protein
LYRPACAGFGAPFHRRRHSLIPTNPLRNRRCRITRGLELSQQLFHELRTDVLEKRGSAEVQRAETGWLCELGQKVTLQEKDFAYAKRIASCDVYILQGFIALATLLASEARGHVHRDSARDKSSTIRFSVLLSDP